MALSNDNTILRKKRDNIRSFFESCRAKRAVVTNTPLEIFLEVANSCNLSCKMCSTHKEGWAPDRTPFMSKELYESAYPLFENALFLHPFGFGEPLLHRNFREIIKAAKSNSVYIEFFTNAVLLKEEMARLFVDTGVDRIFISFDGATKETYEDIHIGAKYEKVIANLRFLDSLKKQQGKSKPRLCINFIAMQSNFHELPQLFELGATWGLSSVEVKSLVTYDRMPEMDKEKKLYDPATDAEIIEKCNEVARRNNITMYLHQFMAATCEDVHALSPQEMEDPQMSGYLDRSDARPFCLAPFRTMYIKSDGAVKPCCFHEDSHFLGNANEASLLEIWNGEKFVKFREKMINGQVPKACFHCVENCLRPMQDDSELIYSLIANKVSIAVISLNNAGEIQNTIDSLRAQQHNKEIVDFIAVDIGSADRTVEILEENEVKTFRFDPDNDIDLLRFVLEKTTGFTISLVHGDAMPIYGQWLDSIPFASWRSSSGALLISDRRQGSSGTGALGEKGAAQFSDYTIIRKNEPKGLDDKETLSHGDLKCISFEREAIEKLLEMDVELNTAYDVLFNLYRQGFEIILSTRSLVRPGLSTQALSLEQMERTLFAHMFDESEKSSDQQILRQFLQSHQEYLENKMEQVARTNSDIIRDVRVLENVVANLLNRWPLRIMRAFKGFFKKKRD